MYSFVGRRSTTAETTAAAAHLRVTTHMFFSHSRTLVVPGTFLRVLYTNIHHHVAFARELEEKEKNTEQDQPAVRSALAAAAAAAAAAAEAAAAQGSSNNSNSNSSSSRKAEAAEDAESTSGHLRNTMYSVYSSTRFFGLILWYARSKLFKHGPAMPLNTRCRAWLDQL